MGSRTGLGGLASRISRRGWIFAALLALLAASGVVERVISEPGPASRFGLAYGTAAAVLLVGAALYGARRRLMKLATRWRMGSARSWLTFHVYGSLLFLVLIHLHAGFRVPVGAVTWWLWALSLWTVATGLLGRGLQLWIPRALGSGLPVEVLYERIPELVDQVRGDAEALVADCDESIQTMYAGRVGRVLAAPRRRPIYFVDQTGGMQAELRDFDYLRTFLPAAEKEKLDRLAGYFKTKLYLDAHFTLQGVLRVWHWAHVPASLAVVALLAAHLFSVLYY